MTGDEWLMHSARARDEALGQLVVTVLAMLGEARDMSPQFRPEHVEQAGRLLALGDSLAMWLEVGGDEG